MERKLNRLGVETLFLFYVVSQSENWIQKTIFVYLDGQTMDENAKHYLGTASFKTFETYHVFSDTPPELPYKS